MSYSQTWLEDPSAIRIVLIIATAYSVVSATEVPFYFSTTGYVTTDGTHFNPIIASTVGFQESISEEGSTSMSFGDIELHNLNGELDELLDSTKYIWSNRPIKIYWGDPGWKYSLASINPSNYLTIFDGVIDDIDTRSNRTVNFRVRDKMERLNGPLSENKIGTYGVWAGGQQNKDDPRPFVFGEVFNISPVLINPAALEYTFNSDNPEQVPDSSQTSIFAANGASEELLEIRDNGVPIYRPNSVDLNGATVDLATSTFKLKKTPAGTITCSVQGMKKTVNLVTGTVTNTYTNSIPNTIAAIVTQLGKDSTRFLPSDLDLPTFNAFNQTAEIGLSTDSSQNLLTTCEEIASSLGAQLIVGRTGLLRLIQFGVPLTSVSSVDITPNDILYDSLNVSRRLDIKAATRLAYAKNYTIQERLLSAIPDQHKKSFETEWLTTTVSNSSVKILHKLDVLPPEKETSLISTADANAEAARLNNYFDEQRVVYSFTGRAKLLNLVLGQGVVLYHYRFGLTSGKSGQVISLSPNWNSQEIEVEVIV